MISRYNNNTNEYLFTTESLKNLKKKPKNNKNAHHELRSSQVTGIPCLQLFDFCRKAVIRRFEYGKKKIALRWGYVTEPSLREVSIFDIRGESHALCRGFVIQSFASPSKELQFKLSSRPERTAVFTSHLLLLLLLFLNAIAFNL